MVPADFNEIANAASPHEMISLGLGKPSLGIMIRGFITPSVLWNFRDFPPENLGCKVDNKISLVRN
jgi:hypothetical protein